LINSPATYASAFIHLLFDGLPQQKIDSAMAAGMTMDDNLRASSWQLTGEKCNKFQREKCKMHVGKAND